MIQILTVLILTGRKIKALMSNVAKSICFTYTASRLDVPILSEYTHTRDLSLDQDLDRGSHEPWLLQ